MQPFILLLLAIACEVVSTTSLKLSQGMTRLVPSLVVVGGYGVTFYLASLSIKTIPLSVYYTIWSGLGTAGTVMIGRWLFQESFSIYRVTGIVLILAGVMTLTLSGEVHK